MLLTGYSKEISRPCNPNFQSVDCVAHLHCDISEVLPFLNSALGGNSYVKDPPSVTFKVHGKLITLHSRKICINALRDEAEADKILEWLKTEINTTWEKRGEMEPSYEVPPRPQWLHVLKLLPKTNCGKCGEPTCMVFALKSVEGIKGAEGCPEIDSPNRERFSEYLAGFSFDV